MSDGQTYVPIKHHPSRVFTPQQEEHIADYAIKVARMFYGLSIREFRRMVYVYAIACGSQSIPEAWETERMATRDWYYAYMSHHPNLVLKAPEGMSIARIVGFNKVNVDVFFKAYTLAMEKYAFPPNRIYNLDESALVTVMKPVKVVCERGRPVATQVSRERGATMTFVGIINAVGQSLPPVFIIPRKRWNDIFMRGTIYGSKGILQANGWMNGECFVQTLQHVHEQSGSSVDNKILLIMDNAECHMNIHAVEFAIQHGIVIVTLPPHTTDKLQPLDVSVFGPFKTYIRGQLNDYALMHPNKHITEHMLPEFASNAWNSACTPTNVLSGFRATGIWPINRHIFADEAFVGAQVTERPAPSEDDIGGAVPTLDQELELTPVVCLSADDDDDELPPASSDVASPDPATPGPSTSAAPATPGPSTSAAPATPGPSTSAAPATPGPSTSADHATRGPSTSAAPATPGPSTSAAPATPGPFTSAAPATPGPSTSSAPATPGPLTSDGSTTSNEVTPESVRPFPKALPRPYAKGRKRVRACILTENEEALFDLRAKAEKKKKAEEKKKAAAEKRKTKDASAAKTKGKRRQKSGSQELSSEEEDDPEPAMPLRWDDSSEYSDEVEEEDVGVEGTYPFAEKELEVRHFLGYFCTLILVIK